MRKEGDEFKCSRCEKELAEVAETQAPVKVITAKPEKKETLKAKIEETAEAIADKVVETAKAQKNAVNVCEDKIAWDKPTEKYETPKVIKVVKPKVATNPPATIECEKFEPKKIAETIKATPTKDESADIKKKLDETDFATLGGKTLAMGKTEDGSYLGYLLGYSIGDRLIPHEVADKQMNKLGMPEDIRPSKSRERDAFKNACSMTEKEETFSSPTLSKKYGASAKFRAVYKADQVKDKFGNPHEYIIDRKIFLADDAKEGKTTKKSDIQFDRLARVTLVIEDEDTPKETCHIEAEPMQQGDEKTAKYLKDVIIGDWKTLMKSYTSKQVRDALRKFIRQGDGIPFTTGRGGLWFMPRAHEDNIKRWAEFCEWCDKQTTNGSDNRVDLRIMPALDLYGLRSKIARDLSDEVQQRVKNLLEDTYAKLKDETEEKKIEEVLAKQLASKREDVDGLLTKYKKILKDEIGIKLKIDIARQEKVEENLSPKAKAMLRQIMNV